jgi:photosystem II stability/assembly factor-like uncharacterized protein
MKLSIPRPARGPVRVASGVALIGAMALAGCGPVGSASSSGSSGTPPSGAPMAATSAAPSASPVVSNDLVPGFQVLSMTFVSAQQGFALGTVGCGSTRCVALLGTSDGGGVWRRLTAPTTTPAGPAGANSTARTCPSSQPCVSQVRFATPLIGYAYGPSLLVTSDGGGRWSRATGADVSSLEAANGTVARVASSAPGCSGMRSQIGDATVGGGTWQALPAPAIGTICPPVLYRQGNRLVLAGYGNPAGGVRATAQIARSSDGGKTWASGPDKCGGASGYASGVALAPPDVLVLMCQAQKAASNGTFGPAWVRVSVNGGATFGPDRQVVSGPAAPPGTLLQYQLAAASDGRLLVVETGSSGSRALLTENGGQTWSPALSLAPGPDVVLVGYQNPLTARIAQGDKVWTTSNGGQTWTHDRF